MQFGRTAFKIAAEHGDNDCMRLLAARGADMHVPDNVRRTFCTIAQYDKLFDFYRFGNSALYLSTSARVATGIVLIPENRAAINIVYASLCDTYQTQRGETALMFACMINNIESVRLILDGGADVNVRDSVRMNEHRIVVFPSMILVIVI